MKLEQLTTLATTNNFCGTIDFQASVLPTGATAGRHMRQQLAASVDRS
jgi:hypothetical protein